MFLFQYLERPPYCEGHLHYNQSLCCWFDFNDPVHSSMYFHTLSRAWHHCVLVRTRGKKSRWLMPLQLRIAKNLTSTRLNMGLEIWRRVESHSYTCNLSYRHAPGSASLVNNSSTSGHIASNFNLWSSWSFYFG